VTYRKPPLGVRPLYIWESEYPDPTVADLRERYADVFAAVCRNRDAGREPRPEWLRELGVLEVPQ
jgi:hypothetical protein